MGKLAETVSRAKELHLEMKRLATAGDAADKLDVIRLRSQYSRAIIEVMQAKDGEPQFVAELAKKQSFDRLFMDMRKALSEHQGNWGPREIERDPAGYAQSVKAMSESQDAFFDWSTANLA